MAQHRNELEGFTFVKVLMGDSPEDTASHWATDLYGIRGVPTLYLFKGEDVPRPVNARNLPLLIKELTDA